MIGALTQVLVAPEDPAAVLARIAHADTRIVSLTVTEKGYDAHTIGLLVRGLEARMKHGRGPLTLLSCDNLPHNGERLRARVLAFAEQADAPLQAWIASGCTFPNSMVDRIVPATTDADRERIAQRLGLHDAWPVVAEPFFDWVVEDRFAAGRPAWDAGGARFVDSAEPYERIKLRMVNGSHSALAYLGLLDGLEMVDQAMATPLRAFIDRLMRDEIAPTLPAVAGFDIDAQRERLLKRFANPALRHSLRQIASDGSQKLPQRLLDTIRDRLRAGESIDGLARAVAGWMAFVRIAGPVNDPLFTTFEGVFGDLAAEPRFFARDRDRPAYSTAFTMSSTTFFASPNTIIVLSM